ncbi:hypothetical protein SKAU_G00158060 [Synaphobranchus kaupii]|uniref:Uncharacterized protein n=1 Tax=Synaphobranchus kaupii TaxID=118154 RepID=A0A9Q1IYL5_SYNKA|nr:hypothetical protein SKAU_G00158060 [Synaphobranchus kaupii]
MHIFYLRAVRRPFSSPESPTPVFLLLPIDIRHWLTAQLILLVLFEGISPTEQSAIVLKSARYTYTQISLDWGRARQDRAITGSPLKAVEKDRQRASDSLLVMKPASETEDQERPTDRKRKAAGYLKEAQRRPRPGEVR